MKVVTFKFSYFFVTKDVDKKWTFNKSEVQSIVQQIAH